MSSAKTVKENKIIKELINLLYEGCEIQENFIKEYRLSFRKQLFVFPHFFRYKSIVKVWINNVKRVLEENLPDSRYIVEFMYPTDRKKTVYDVSEWILELVNKLESHIYVLKEIIRELDSNKPNLIVNEKILVRNTGLILNETQATLKFKQHKQIDIQLTTQPIKFLILLLKDGNKRIIKDKEFADVLNLNSKYYTDDKIMAREIQFVRKELIKTLEKAGMKDKDIKQLIKRVKNTGYKSG